MLETIIGFIISIGASIIGSITGIGGGILMKPVLDSLGLLSVSTVSFLSGCTVMTMAAVSLWRGRKSEVKLQFRTATLLAVGGIVGGLLGNILFDQAKVLLGGELRVGIIQSAILLVITFAVLVYCRQKHRVPSYQYSHFLICLSVGLGLGLISAFLGIGGGPMNLAVLFLFFSMPTKVAAKNSLYIIFCSQVSSLILSLANHSIPTFQPMTLVMMMTGGVIGAIIGSKVGANLTDKQTDYSFQGLLLIIAGVTIYNIVQFALQL